MSPTTAEPAPSAQPGVIADPFRSYNFSLTIGGRAQGHFTRIDGFGVKIERVKYRSGGENQQLRMVPGQVEFSPITLRYGLTDSREMMDWLFQSVNGTFERKDVVIALLNDAGNSAVRRWSLISAWPFEWTGAPLDALGHDLAIESLSLSYDRLELEDAAPTVA